MARARRAVIEGDNNAENENESDRAANTLAYLLGKRLDQGATVEPGHYTIEGGLAGLSPIGELSTIHDMGVEIRTDLDMPEIFTGAASS